MSEPLIPEQPSARTVEAPRLRLQLSHSPGRGALDGAWWPRSRDLPTELADLVDHFPTAAGRIVHPVYSPPDWTSRIRRLRTARGSVKTGCYPEDDTASVLLGLASRQVLKLMVVPPDTPPRTARHLMRVASDPRNRSTPRELLADIEDTEADAPSGDLWTDDGGSWWDAEQAPPSTRDR